MENERSKANQALSPVGRAGEGLGRDVEGLSLGDVEGLGINGEWLLCAVLYLVINLLFITKYGLRVGVMVTVAAAVVYVAAVAALLTLLRHGAAAGWKWLSSGKTLWVALGLFTALFVGVQYSIDPYSLQVDRWSAIHNFIDYLLQGKYPYMAQTHLGGYGSPFPVWQVVHIPFYFLNNVGLSTFLTLFLAVVSVKRLHGTGVAFAFLALMAFSPSFLYDIVVRSDLSANFLLVLALVNGARIFGLRLSAHVGLYAVVIGLMLSTRVSVAVPFFIVLLVPFLGLPLRKKAALVAGVAAVWCVTFLPLLLWNSDGLLFFRYSPFVLQTRQGSPVGMVVLLCLFVWLGLRGSRGEQSRCDGMTNGNGVYCNIAYAMFLLTAVTFAVNMVAWDNYRLFSSTYDISYFNMALPFAAMAMTFKGKKVKK